MTVNIHTTNSGFVSVSERFPVSVVMQMSQAVSQWQEHQWQVIGIVAVKENVGSDSDLRLIHQADGVKQYLLSGYTLELYRDECESYYHNLMTPTPGCFVIAHCNEDEMPEPFIVTLSFDEAHSYQEGGEEVYAVDIPPEIYKWVEAYVLKNYTPEPRKKRKRDNWKQQQPHKRN